ncbi:MAG: cytochrome c [Burkholderiales bacterium]|nr:cytochrome c [Burkholderiales bacterium]
MARAACGRGLVGGWTLRRAPWTVAAGLALALAAGGAAAQQAAASAPQAHAPASAPQADAPASAAPTNVAGAAGAAGSAPSAAVGRRVYTSTCARCHGLNLVVGSSAFFDLRTFPRGEKARFLRSVRQGLRAMPAWEGIVKPEEMESIWLYIGSVNGWPAE